MASPDTPYTVTYRKPGTEPPVYLAGTFSDWQPQRMQSTRLPDGEYLFSHDIKGVAGRAYEVKFKIGEGNWWVYDEDKPVVTDCDGNENNIITIPLPGSCETDRRPSVGKVLNELGLRDHGCDLPPKVVPNTGLSITQPVKKENTSRVDTYQVPNGAADSEYTWQKQEPDPLKTPLFAHECLGAYEFTADDRMDHVDALELEHRRQSRKLSKDYTVDQVDLNDPSIEKFPSDKSSVFDSLRKIQSSLPADQIPVDDAPAFSGIEFRRSSVDSGDDSAISTGSMSPTTPTPLRMRENRASHSSVGKTKSTVSLTSIAEEPKAGDQSNPRTPASSLLRPDVKRSSSGTHSPPSDGEGAMTMRGYQAKHKHIQADRTSPSYDSMDEPRLGYSQALGASHEIA